MPALYAHKKFGDVIAAALGGEFPEMQEQRVYFALGLHGPDPLFYHKPLKANAVRRRGDALHEASAAGFFREARGIYLARGRRAEDRAYLYGFVCHFCLDSVCHAEVAAQMRLCSMTHAGIESAFERMLLLEDGQAPEKAVLTRHLDASAAEAMAAYCGVSSGQAKKAVRSMRFYSALLRCPNACKRALVLFGLRIAGKYDSIAPMMIPTTESDAVRKSNAALRALFDRATNKALALIPALRAYLDADAPLSARFDSNFESEEPA